jgi:hypothetical protein
MNMHPLIIVICLQHEGLPPASYYNDLKEHFKWIAQCSAESVTPETKTTIGDGSSQLPQGWEGESLS